VSFVLDLGCFMEEFRVNQELVLTTESCVCFGSLRCQDRVDKLVDKGLGAMICFEVSSFRI
jgi:hypothetical protein